MALSSAELIIEKRHQRRLDPWVKKAVRLIDGKMGDTRAHAENAVTQILRDTPDGRATAGRIRQSRSYQAAIDRIDELWEIIGGPSVTSTDGMVHDACESFYFDSRLLWWNRVPEEFRVRSRESSGYQIANVRSLLWFGLPVRTGFEVVITSAKNGLLASLGTAGTSTTSRRDGMASLRTWEEQHKRAIMMRMGLALNDANQRADLQAMRDTIRPEFQSED